MAKYNRDVMLELCDELIDRAKRLRPQIEQIPPASAEVIDMITEQIGKAISHLKQGTC